MKTSEFSGTTPRSLSQTEIQLVSGGMIGRVDPTKLIEYLGYLDLPEPKPTWEDYISHGYGTP